MKGYIGVTAYDWWEFLKFGNIETINFWRKSKNEFKVLKQGDYFFFLRKNPKNAKSERQLVGYAEYSGWAYLDVDTAWEKFGKGNGYNTKDAFVDGASKALGSPELTNVGCIILKNPVCFKEPLSLSKLEIPFALNIVQGKSIDEYECIKIFQAGCIKPSK